MFRLETDSKSNHWHLSTHTTLPQQAMDRMEAKIHTHTQKNNFTNKWDRTEKRAGVKITKHSGAVL
jgi:hypothetical protein